MQIPQLLTQPERTILTYHLTEGKRLSRANPELNDYDVADYLFDVVRLLEKKPENENLLNIKSKLEQFMKDTPHISNRIVEGLGKGFFNVDTYIDFPLPGGGFYRERVIFECIDVIEDDAPDLRFPERGEWPDCHDAFLKVMSAKGVDEDTCYVYLQGFVDRFVTDYNSGNCRS